MRPRDLVAVKKLWPKLVHKHPKLCCKIYYYWMLKRRLHLKNPRDLNEKIQWLKFHEDMNEWARLADKYRVREYLKEKGLDNLLVKLYGKFDTREELMEAWGSLPKTFILKSNNGCATNIVVKDKVFNLGKTIDDFRHQVAEHVADVLQRVIRILHHVVEQGADDRSGAEVHLLAANHGHGDGMVNVRLTALAPHTVVRIGSQHERLADGLALVLVGLGVNHRQQFTILAHDGPVFFLFVYNV